MTDSESWYAAQAARSHLTQRSAVASRQTLVMADRECRRLVAAGKGPYDMAREWERATHILLGMEMFALHLPMDPAFIRQAQEVAFDHMNAALDENMESSQAARREVA